MLHEAARLTFIHRHAHLVCYIFGRPATEESGEFVIKVDKRFRERLSFAVVGLESTSFLTAGEYESQLGAQAVGSFSRSSSYFRYQLTCMRPSLTCSFLSPRFSRYPRRDPMCIDLPCPALGE